MGCSVNQYSPDPLPVNWRFMTIGRPPNKLLDQARDAQCRKHDSRHTEEPASIGCSMRTSGTFGAGTAAKRGRHQRFKATTGDRRTPDAIRHQLSAIRYPLSAPSQLPLDRRADLEYTGVVYSERRSACRTGYDPWLTASPLSIAHCAF